MLPIKAKKIAVVCNYQIQPDRIGGMDRFFIAFNNSLAKQNHTIDWFFTDSKMFDFYEELNVLSTNKQNIEEFFLNHLIKENKKYDIVITHFTELCTSFYKQIKQLTNAYCIAVDHNPRPLQGFPFKKRIKLKLKGVLYSKYIDVFIGVSKYTKNEILKDYGKWLDPKVKVIYNGIDTTVFKNRRHDNKNKFIVASHLRPSKGIQDLIEAVALLDKEKQNQLQIDIYGEGPYENELKNRVTEDELNNCISFKGSSSKLNELFCDYNYMLQPTYMECFSLSILESLSANVPVITTQVGGNLEIIIDGENGFIFQAGDVKTLKTIIANIIDEEITIDTDVSHKIENQFYLNKMVDEHIKMIEL